MDELVHAFMITRKEPQVYLIAAFILGMGQMHVPTSLAEITMRNAIVLPP